MSLDLSILGWIHSAACVVALALGGFMLLSRKGSPRHKAVGRIFAPTMVVVCLTSLGIYNAGRWFFPHTLAVVTLGLIALGWLAARFKQPRGLWIHIHLTAMILSYQMLVGGGVNEVFLRVDALRAITFAPEAQPTGGIIIGMTHTAVSMVFLIWIVAANTATAVAGRMRRQRLASAPA